MSMDLTPEQLSLAYAQVCIMSDYLQQLSLPCGILRGALANLGKLVVY